MAAAAGSSRLRAGARAGARAPRARCGGAPARRRGAARVAPRCAGEAPERDERLSSTMSNLDALLGPDEAKQREAARMEREREAAVRRAAEAEAAKEDEQVSGGDQGAFGFFGSDSSKQQGEKGIQRASGKDQPGEHIADRTIASLAYLLPLFDGLRYSKFLLLQVPQLGLLLAPLAPAYQMYAGAGFFGNLILFFGLYFGIAKNNSLSNLVRFNAAQAIVLDIVLILPDVLLQGFGGVGSAMGDAGVQVQIIFFNTVFLATYLSCVYGVGSSLITGKTKATELPFIADAARMQAGVFEDDD